MLVDGWAMIPLGNVLCRSAYMIVSDKYVYSNSWCDPFKTWQYVSTSTTGRSIVSNILQGVHIRSSGESDELSSVSCSGR